MNKALRAVEAWVDGVRLIKLGHRPNPKWDPFKNIDRVEGARLANPPFCPECETLMVERINSRNGSHFWGCRNFPRCRGTFNIDGSKTDWRKVKERHG